MNLNKLLRKQKLSMEKVKSMMGNNVANTLKAMSHTESCDDCTKKFEAILEHGGISRNDSKFGILKMAKHQSKCPECAKLFSEIAIHSGTLMDKTKPVLTDVVDQVVKETK
jgi:hypothetical protein